jgi:hypothetical protein
MKKMRYLRLLNQTKIQDVSFESRYLPGGVIGGKGSEELYPKIHLKNGREINDICVGFQICTEDKFKKGETIGNCLARHGAKIEDVEKIVVVIIDMMTKNKIHEELSWTPESGWKQGS